MIRKYSILIVCCLFLSDAMALSFGEAYKLLLEKNLSYKRATLDFKADKQLVSQARAKLFPSIDVAGGTGYIQSDTVNLEGDTRESRVQSQDDIDLSSDGRRRKELSINIRQPIYNRVLSMQYRQAKSRLLESELRLRNILEQQIISLAQVYFGLLKADLALDVAQREVEAVEKHHKLTTRRLSEGLNNKADVHEAFARAKVSVSGLLDARQEKTRHLNQLLNTLQLTEGDLYLPKADLEKIDIIIEVPDIYELIKENLETNIEYKIQKQLVNSSNFAMRVDSAAMLPKIDLTASRSKTETEAFELGDELSTDDNKVMIELNIPLFKGGGNLSKSKESKYRHEAEEVELKNVSNNVSVSIRNHYEGFKTAFFKMQTLRASFESLSEVLELRKEGYMEGLVSNLDVLNAYRDKHRAEASWSNSIYDYIESIVKMNVVLGQFDQEDVNTIDDFLVKEERTMDIRLMELQNL